MTTPHRRRPPPIRPARGVFVVVALLLGLAACGRQQGKAPRADAAPSPASGWVLDPGDDLNRFFDCLADQGIALVSAHRGGPTPGWPENALETFAHTLEQAPAILEIDVAASADGVLYLMHDDRLERTTTGGGPADAAFWPDIAGLSLRDPAGRKTGFSPTRFDDALAWASARTIVQIDFKPSARYEDVTREVARQGAEDRVIYIAYSLAQAKKLHRLAPRSMISLSLNAAADVDRAVAAGIPEDRLLAFTGVDAPDPRLFTTLAERRVEVIFGTLGGRGSIDRQIAASGDAGPYVELAGAGVDIIATDRPLAAQAALAAAGRGARDGACGISKANTERAP